MALSSAPVASSVPLASSEAQPTYAATAVKTVKQSRAAEPDGDVIPIAGEPMPSPDQIFDFHPPGSRADAWRQPFVINDTGGPLDRYRAETAAMLKQLQDPTSPQKPAVPSKGSPAPVP